MNNLIKGAIGFCLTLTAIGAQALTFKLPSDGGDVIGQTQKVRVYGNDSLTDIARKYDIGYYELLEANPKLNPAYIMNGTPVIIPTQYVLPNAAHQGIVINLAELRLYYYPKGSNTVVTEPIGIGRQGWDTPTGSFKVIQKIKDPDWHPPASIKADMAQYGTVLPDVVPAGPDNPLGQYAMRLSLPSYLIHGTNDPTGVGRRVSSGCIRMYPEDIESLFAKVPNGTPVAIVNEPYKLGVEGKKLVMESHKPLAEMRHQYADNLQAIWVDAIDNFVAGLKIPAVIDWGQVDQTAKLHIGIPQPIGYTQA